MKKEKFDDLVTFIYVGNMSRSADFYSRVLGLKLRLDQGTCRIYQVAPGACLGICARKEGGVRRDAVKEGVILTLVTDKVDDWYERLRGEGVRILDPPRINEKFQIYHFFLEDPDGYKLEVQKFLDPAWSAGRSEG